MNPLLLLLMSLSSLLALDSSEFTTAVFKKDGVTLPYRSLRLGSAEQEVPLLLFLHGAGERGTDNEVQLQHGIPELVTWLRKTGQSCHIIAPQCPHGVWWGEVSDFSEPNKITLAEEQPQAEALLALLEAVGAESAIDSKRIYLTGLSMGGFGSFGLLAIAPNKWAAAIPICGGGDASTVDKYAHVPLHIVHGDSDTVVPTACSRTLVKALEEAGATKVQYTEFLNTGHDSWTLAYRNPKFWEWMFAQKKG